MFLRAVSTRTGPAASHTTRHSSSARSSATLRAAAHTKALQQASQQVTATAEGPGALKKRSRPHPGNRQRQPRHTYTAPPPQETITVQRKWLPDDDNAWQNAVVLIDKPLGFTSFDVCGKLRALLSIKKVGHAGTLDPNATGLLIVCIGRATKKVNDFVAMDKEYTGVIRLGQGTPSFDTECAVSEEQPWEHLTDEALTEAAATFVGHSEQLPPMFSAIRVDGKRLYEAARAGKEVIRPPRQIHITTFDLERSAPGSRDVIFRVACSKGTYIRSLAHDLGQRLGTVAHLVALRRTKIGPVSVDDAWHLDDMAQLVRERRSVITSPLAVTEKTHPDAQQHDVSSGNIA